MPAGAYAASSPPPSLVRHRRTLSTTLIDESVAAAAALVHRWHPDDDACSLFLHAADDAPKQFLAATADLHRAMLFFASAQQQDAAPHSGLFQAQALLQTAMRRLDLELQLLLAPDVNTTNKSVRAVAHAMIAAGYGKECLSTFKSRRRAALATKLLAFSPPAVNKLAWDQVDHNIIQPWLAAATLAFSSLFVSEKDLCDSVFAGDHAAVGEAVFAAIANDHATNLLAIAEAAVARARRAPERLFRVLDVHDTLAEILAALMSVFGDDSEVATRAAVAINKAGEAARGTLAAFEAAIQKEPSKATAPDGAVHPLTRYVMNYLVFLADYEEALARIYQHQAGDCFSTSSSSPSSSLSTNISPIARLVRVLLCKLESKAGNYREAALSYLFLANNTHYVGSKVRGSSKLQAILGEDWAEAQGAKARGHVEVYVSAAWGKVLTAISPAMNVVGRGEAVEAAVMEAAAMQEQWAAADDEMSQALRVAATAAVVPKYRMFYRRHGAAVRLTPGDVTATIAALFGGPLSSSTITASASSCPPDRCTS